jgi:hypothetical protein
VKRRAWLTALLLLLLASPLHAQASASTALDRIDQHLQAHRYADARQLLAAWWQESGEAATGDVRARALYLRAVLADDLAQAEHDLLRIAIEHPQAEHADAALLRLAQARFAHDDSTGAETFLERLVQDHPQSEHRAEALRLLGRRDLAPPLPQRAPSPANAARPTAAAAATRAPSRGAEIPPPGAEFAVQLGGFARVGDAEALRTQLRTAGFDAYLARLSGSAQTLVRVGSFRERAGAETMLRRLRAAGHDGDIVAISAR